jgi:hypothetical protein
MPRIRRVRKRAQARLSGQRDAAHADRPVAVSQWVQWRSPVSLLLPIGEALAKLVCEEDFGNVNACAGHSCTPVCAHGPEAGKMMVQHGDLRQSRQASRAQQSAQEITLTSRLTLSQARQQTKV